MTLARNALKAKIATGAMVTGTLAMDMRAPAYVHLLADAGFDSIFLTSNMASMTCRWWPI